MAGGEALLISFLREICQERLCVYFVPNSRNELFSAPSYLNPQALNFFLFLWGNFFFSNYLDNQNPYIYFLNVLDTIKYV